MKLSGPSDKVWKAQGEKDIAVLMSGGVDSSVTALLLKEECWNVAGITMKIPYADMCDYRRSCCGMEAAYICRDLDIAHYFIDVQDEFRSLVIDRFSRSYRAGLTPSPCVDCNTELKFSRVWDFITDALGIAHMASGHYARVLHEQDNYYLASATDSDRDQSYFLYGVERDRLPYLHFPLGDMKKPDVRRIAKSHHLAVARRTDSMELCFAGEGDYREAIGDVKSSPGYIVDVQGNAIGSHDGIYGFTIGQRKGIGVAVGKPLYVTELDAAQNRVVVGEKDTLFKHVVQADEVNILQPHMLKIGQMLYGKIRSQGDASACAVLDASTGSIEVRFEEAVFAPAPGQRLVLYDDVRRVVAGGIITGSE